MPESSFLNVGLAQIAPVWLNRTATLAKVVAAIREAADQGCRLVVFGEACVPGYPNWLSVTGGAVFNDTRQKEIFDAYSREAVCLERGDCDAVCRAAAEAGIAVYLGIIERPRDRGGQSLYCSFVYVNEQGRIASVHRKLQPTYEERLVWSPGDGHGLRVHELDDFRVGGLNCWENWMPLARSALYAQGCTVHVACWPGSDRNTRDITRFIAMESRAYVLSVSCLLRREDIADDLPHAETIRANLPAGWIHNGGSCVAAPDGSWLLEPQTDREGVFVAQLDLSFVRRERQNFDPSGHYARPDVTRLSVNRKRQSMLDLTD
ncbi:carbon-nitrogen hydrolase family protein [Acanthopleuribacter pedis]|uniref:Carbon-nitrogen hydrolase family protein n=1 Tax=Acanthopleuribacter pedis TaxID=442870 RepID=A0A8J7QFF7_9BACT|nr:carbon-nitrogen hydrolase family protein [Acanthopleuribacter pedis]MBO1317455.1 carbon-nitrogen hydrolase family protein [Acanthopleuribacter pedis]